VGPASSLIERITYTASLATNPKAIDSILDSFRDVTVRIDPAKPLSSSDHAKLVKVQHELEKYLVQKETLRSFTAESLRLQIEQHLQGNVGKKSQARLSIVIVLAIVLALVAALVPHLDNPEQRGLTGGATVFSLLTVGAAWLFLTALPAFQSSLRRAFVIICIAVALLGLCMLGQPIMEIYDLRRFPLTSVLYTLPILIAAILFHTGNIMYVRLIGVKSVWTTAKPLLIAFVLSAVLTCLMPHPHTGEPEFVHDLVATMWAWITLTPIASTMLLPKAIRKLPELYKPSIRLLLQSLFPILAVTSYQYVLRLFAAPTMQGPVAYVLFTLVTFMGLGLLRAGYEFNKVSQY